MGNCWGRVFRQHLTLDASWRASLQERLLPRPWWNQPNDTDESILLQDVNSVDSDDGTRHVLYDNDEIRHVPYDEDSVYGDDATPLLYAEPTAAEQSAHDAFASQLLHDSTIAAALANNGSAMAAGLYGGDMFHSLT